MLSRIAVTRPVMTMMLFLAVVMLGVVSYRELAIQLLPDFTLPQMGIWVQREGSAADILEKTTQPIEEIVRQVPNIKSTESSTRTGSVWMRLEFEHGTDMRFTVLDIEERLNAWRQKQEDRRLALQVFPFSTEEFRNNFMELSFQIDHAPSPNDEEVLAKVEETLRSIQGMAQVEINGRVTDTVRVLFNPEKLKSYGVTFGQVIGAVGQAAAEQHDLGRLQTENGSVFVRIGDRLSNVQQLENVPLNSKGIIRLRDVAEIDRSPTLDKNVFRVNGMRSIGISLQKEAGVNLITLAKTTRGKLEELKAQLPPGYSVAINEDFAKIIEKTIDGMIEQALVGILLAGLVPLFFLRSLRMAAIIFLSIPVSLIATFNLMYAFGLSINVLSIVGLAIGVSILVDNSIVVLENGFRLAQQGASPASAAMRGGEEVGRALAASTATTIVVFVPIFFSEGEIRLIFREGALAVAFPLLISLTVALALVPVLTARALTLRAPGQRNRLQTWVHARLVSPALSFWPWRWSDASRKRSLWREGYRAILKRCLRFPVRTLVIVLAFCMFTFMEQAGSLSRQSLQSDAGNTYLGFRLVYPRGTSLVQADSMVRRVEKKLSEHKAIDRFWVSFNDEQGRFGIRLKDLADRPDEQSYDAFRKSLFEFIGEVPGAQLSFRGRSRPMEDDSLRMGEGGDLLLKGTEMNGILAMAERVRQALMVFPQITSTEIAIDNDNPEMEVRVDRERSALFQVDAQTVAQYIRTTQRGGTLASVRLEEGEKRTDVIFEIGGIPRNTVDDIRALPIDSPTAGAVPLSEVATFGQQFTSPYFNRSNGQQSVRVRYFVRPDTNMSELSDAIKPVLESLPNPGGIALGFGGSERQRFEREAQAVWMLQLAIVLVFMVMAFIFESYWVPFVILMSIPLISVGVLWALLLAGKPVDDLVWFGALLLAGVVVNAPIVMLDRCQQLRMDYKFRPLRALFQSCDQRLRPVAMTVLTTIIGLVPLALADKEEAQWSSLALTIIGGLISSTILTLLVIPCLYLVCDDLNRRLMPIWIGFWRGFAWVYGRTIQAIGFLLVGLPRLLWRNRAWRFWLWPKWAWIGARHAWKGLKFCWRHAILAIKWTWKMAKLLIRWSRECARTLLRKPRAPEKTATILEVNRSLEGPWFHARGDGSTLDPDAPPFAVRSLRVIYNAAGFSPKSLVPSRRYVIGGRPIRGNEALSDINLTIQPGLFGLLGPNGAGKTTLMRCMIGLLKPTRGTVHVFGADLRRHAESIAPMIGYLPQNHGLYGHMTLRQYLEYFLLLRMRSMGEAITRGELDRAVEAAADEVHLLAHLEEHVGRFSGGMKQRAGLARVLIGAPPILLVDEPTAGLDPIERVKVRLLLAQLAQKRTVIFSTHIVEDLELSCREVGIVRSGKLLYSGAPQDLLGRLEGRLWEIPIHGAAAREAGLSAALGAAISEKLEGSLAATSLGSTSIPLFRVVRAEGSYWRCISPEAPSHDAMPSRPRLEDALLALLRSATPAERAKTRV